MSEWFRNGQPADGVAMTDRALHYGDGVFETIAIRDGQARLWSLHEERLRLGCERLGLAAPPAGALTESLETALQATSLQTDFATAKLMVSAGDGPRGYRRHPESQVELMIGVFEASRLDPAAYRQGIALFRCNTRLAVQPQLAGIKSLNRLEQVLARAEWSDSTLVDGIMLDTGGRLICGTMSNVFLVCDNTLLTPGLTRCGVAGVMRRHLLSLLNESGFSCDIRDVSTDELANASEVFVTNSQFGAVPVRRIGDSDYSLGSMTRRAQALLANNGVPECGQ